MTEKPRKAQAKRRTRKTGRSLWELLNEQQIGPEDWDYAIVGDGSAQTVNQEAGAASFLIERRTGKLEPFYTVVSHADVATAELLAYLAPLRWLDRHRRPELKEPEVVYRVLIITDSQFIARAGNGQCAAGEAAEFLLPLQLSARRGLSLQFVWIPRDQHTLNQAAHALANFVRRSNLRQIVLPSLAPWCEQLNQRENRGLPPRKSVTTKTQRARRDAKRQRRRPDPEE